MWSVELTARASVLNAQQRVLFPISNHSDTTSRQLARALLFGICTGVTLLTPDDTSACQLITTALQNACTKNPLLSRACFAVVVETGAQWSLEQLHERVERVLQHLQLKSLDVLLLRARTLALADSSSTYERKRVVLRFWDAMLALQQSGLVAHVGVSGFSPQLTEFIFTAHPQNPPVAIALSIHTATSAMPPESHADGGHSASYSLSSAVAFAHARGMDVLVNFPFRTLETMPLAARERWREVTRTVARMHREQSVEVVITNEADAEPFQMQTRSMHDTSALQTPLQVAVRYLLQKGLVVIPSAATAPSSSESSSHDGDRDDGHNNDALLDDDECYELFQTLLHPFTALAPSHSTTKLYSSLLSHSDMDVIDRALCLRVHTPSAPPVGSPSI